MQPVHSSLIHGSVLLLLALLCLPGTAMASSAPLAQELSLHSRYLNESRSVRVFVPESYYDSSIDFPTLYVLDGQWYGNLVALTVNEANRFIPLLPDFIVVAIDNQQRWKDFTEQTSEPSESRIYSGPYQAENFRNYLTSELIPKIEAQYRVNHHRLVFGYSLAGGFLAETLQQDPGLFSNYLLISPYLRWDSDAALRNLSTVKKALSSNNSTVLLAIGGDEDLDTREPAIRLYHGLEAGGRILFDDYPNENHTSMPNAAIFNSLRSLYPHWFPDRATGTAMSAEQHAAYFKKQHQHYLGTDEIQPNVYVFLCAWFGSIDIDGALPCEQQGR